MKEQQKVVLGILLLACGCAIYLLFRSKTLNIYNWCSALGLSTPIDTLRIWVQNWNIPEFVRFCLPDGLYCAAYILLVDAIWYDDNRIVKFLILSVVPIATIGSELLQYFRIVRGTFDIRDLISYAIPSIVYYGIYQSNHNLKTKNL